MALNCKFTITKKEDLGKITDITKEFKITKTVKTHHMNVPNGTGKCSGGSSGKTWNQRR